jgi:LAO/AO transport system kinase
MELTSWPDGWRPPIARTVAVQAEGLDELDAVIRAHRAHLDSTGGLGARRARRARAELERVVRERVAQHAREALGDVRYRTLLDDVEAHRVDPWTAADRLLRAE